MIQRHYNYFKKR